MDTQKDLSVIELHTQLNQSYNELKMKKKKNLNSKTKNSMKNETIRLYNIKQFSKKKIINNYPKIFKNFDTHIYLTLFI